MAKVNSDPPPTSESVTTKSVAIPPTVLSLKELGKTPKEWTLTLYPGHLALAESTGERPYIIVREEVMKTATLMEGARAFVVNQPRKVTFKLTREAVAALADWIGKPLLAGIYLRRRYAWILPIAVIWVLGSLPLPGKTDAGTETLPFDAFGFTLGLVLAGGWFFARWHPHPVLFLVDSLWFIAMGVYLTIDVVNGRSKGWLVLALFGFWLAATGIRHFVRFRGTRIDPYRKGVSPA